MILKKVIENDKEIYVPISFEEAVKIHDKTQLVFSSEDEEDEFEEYLDELENDGCLRINRTAGLDMVYLSEEVPEELEIIQQYYEKRQEQSTRGRTV